MGPHRVWIWPAAYDAASVLFEIPSRSPPISISPDQLRGKSPRPQQVSTLDPSFKELFPGTSVSWEVPLPAVYFDSPNRGNLIKSLWVGGQIRLWDWGTLAEHSNRKQGPFPALILPGGPFRSLAITAEESDIDEVPLPPSPEPLLAPTRVSGAPVLSLSLAGPTTLSKIAILRADHVILLKPNYRMTSIQIL